MLDEGLLSGEVQSVILKEKRLYLSEKLFEDNALVLSGFKSKSITLRSEKFSIKVSWDDCTFLGLWKQPNAPFVCIEPWWGVADDLDHNHFIYDKKGINFLEAGKKKGFWFGMKID